MYHCLVSQIKTLPSSTSTPVVEHTYIASTSALYELTKPRLSLLSVFTTALGFLLHDPLLTELGLFLSLLIGTAFAAAGAATLNQWMERHEDALMPRTSNRPLPANQVHPSFALFFGLLLSILGLATLYFGTNLWAFTLTLATLIIYLCLYTPLKKKSAYATEIGAVSGALPPLIGWVSASGEPSAYGLILFGILFAWQIPHFMAIAWNFRRDYSAGGFKLHLLGSDSGKALSRKSFFYTILLNLIVFSPFFIETKQAHPGLFYLISASILCFYITIPSLCFYLSNRRDHFARKLFFVTIIYLPLLLATLVIDRYL